MKNIKNYCILALVALTSSAIFFACSNDNEQIQEKTNSSKIVNANRLAATICDITGTTVVSSGTAVVAAGSTATYSYTNNTGTASNIVWSISSNPVGSATIISSGSTVTVTYLSNFISGTLSAAGSGGTAQTCNTILNITKSVGTVCCSPTFDAFYICDGTVKGKGAVVPFVDGCDVSTISSIVWNLGGAKWVAGPLAGQSGGTMLPPFNQYSKNIGYYQCQYGMFQISATYNFNNGCPPKTYNLNVTPSN